MTFLDMKFLDMKLTLLIDAVLIGHNKGNSVRQKKKVILCGGEGFLFFVICLCNFITSVETRQKLFSVSSLLYCYERTKLRYGR